MNGRKDSARRLRFGHIDPQKRFAEGRHDLRKATARQTKLCCVLRVDADEGFRRMGAKTRATPRARHGVPLIAHAPCIEHQRKIR